jgi:hypothetical protein
MTLLYRHIFARDLSRWRADAVSSSTNRNRGGRVRRRAASAPLCSESSASLTPAKDSSKQVERPLLYHRRFSTQIETAHVETVLSRWVRHDMPRPSGLVRACIWRRNVRVLIVGATGFIGPAVAARLATQGHQ